MSNEEALKTALEQMQSRATIHNEAGVKRLVRRALDNAGVFSFMPPANAFGRSGISDILAVKHGRIAAIETKYGYNKPTEQQLKFGKNVQDAGGHFCVVNEKDFVEKITNVLKYFWEYDL